MDFPFSFFFFAKKFFRGTCTYRATNETNPTACSDSWRSRAAIFRPLDISPPPSPVNNRLAHGGLYPVTAAQLPPNFTEFRKLGLVTGILAKRPLRGATRPIRRMP